MDMGIIYYSDFTKTIAKPKFKFLEVTTNDKMYISGPKALFAF